MDVDSVVDLEREVEEILVMWSSSTPVEGEILPRVPVTPSIAQGGVSSHQIRDMAGRIPSNDANVRTDEQVGELHRRREARARGTRRDIHPYSVGVRRLIRPPPPRTHGGSYVEELKASWPARYWRLKESMDMVWKRP